MPHLVEVQNELGPKGLVILSMSSEDRATVAQFADSMGVNYAVGAESWSGGDYGIPYVPFSLLLDKEGKIVWQGRPSGAGWVEQARGLLDS